jgi:xylose isomerase
MNIRYSIILGFLGQLKDRFSYYHEPKGLAQKLELASQIEGVKGVEAVYPFDFQDMTFETFQSLLSQNRLDISTVNVNLKAEAKFHLGALTAKDPAVRHEAVAYLKAGIDWAAALGNNLVTVCPLADGHDYPFEIDYRQAWRWLLDCLGEAAAHNPQVRISVEYKQSEPRARVIVPNASSVLLLCEQIGLDNIGVTVDTGHALYAGETPAQVISLAADAGRLFLVHINDNYRNWDWDLIPGSVNFWDWLETIFVLDQVGYQGWLVSDVFPARTDPVETLSASYRAITYAEALLDELGRQRLIDMIHQRESIKVFDELQKHLLRRNNP